MKPAPFAYHRPASLDEALALLAQHADAKALAGGQSLIPAMNFRLARPGVLVDLNTIAELAAVRDDGGVLHLGAMTRQAVAERDPRVATHAPLLAEALPLVAHVQIRNRGTIGGSLAHADPSAELPAVMVALGATFHLRSATGARVMAAEAFFTGLFATALAPGELLVDIAIPRLDGAAGSCFLELARRHGDYALAGVAATLRLDDKGRIRDARIVLVSVGDGPVLAQRAIKAVNGERPGAELFREAAALAGTRDAEPPSDLHASAAYRRQLVTVLTRRALERATTRAAARAQTRQES